MDEEERYHRRGMNPQKEMKDDHETLIDSEDSVTFVEFEKRLSKATAKLPVGAVIEGLEATEFSGLSLKFRRPETDAEVKWRIEYHRDCLNSRKDYEREEYERLKKKFG